jgi:hypothetical protein
MSIGNGWGRVTQIINGSAPNGAGLQIKLLQKHTLFRVFECLDSGVENCVCNIVKEHSSLSVFDA